MWFHLRRLRGEGYHFRRQAPFSEFFLDFVCFNRRLVVEVDGLIHDLPERQEHDRLRDRLLAKAGFRTLRFSNSRIQIDLAGVVAEIRAALAQQSPTRPLRGHPPHEGEGYS